MNLLKQNAALATLSLGITFIIMLAGTDLSSGSNIAFAGACGAIAMGFMGNSDPVSMAIAGIFATLAAGAVMGLINGILVGYYDISPFMATLAVMSLSRGLTLYITDSRRVRVRNEIFNWFGQKDIISFGRYGIPASFLLLLALFFVMAFILNRTTFGRKTYAVGGNPIASRASGIDVKRHTLIVYMLGGLFAGFASIIIVGRAMSAQPLAAVNMEFDAITAVVLGGASLAGGTGSLFGTMLGAFLVGTIFSGLGMMPISPFYSYLVKGILIIVAVYLDQYARIERVKTDKGAYLRDKAVQKAAQGHLHEILSDTGYSPTELKLMNISKQFPGVKALDDVSFTLKRGTVHALMGENGAGKSTLMKVLSGVYKKDGGDILIDDKTVEIDSPIDSQRVGISVIYQEFALVPELSIMQNIFLGKEEQKYGFLMRPSMKKRVRELLDRVGLHLNENSRVSGCTVGQQQMVEIAKAINSNAWVLVMDEPTSAITESEKERLFEIIREFRDQGMAIVYISHRMSEIFEIADEITVLRDGRNVLTAPISEVNEKDIVRSMVGRELSDMFNREERNPREVVLEVKNIERHGVFKPISFTVRSGEVLGLSGLMGAGRTEIARCIFGLDKIDGGEIWLNGEKLTIRNPFDAILANICYVSEDRRREGIVPLMSLRENITLASLPWISRTSVINGKLENVIAEEYIKMLDIKAPSMEQKINNLSGGNQQKACLAKWLCRNPKVIILDEPTRGIDVGAKTEIHRIINELCKRGIAVIMISSEMPEILGSSDQIIVLHEGEMMGKFEDAKATTQEMVMIAASGEALG
jgi:ribose transport system ATP-binding protein